MTETQTLIPRLFSITKTVGPEKKDVPMDSNGAVLRSKRIYGKWSNEYKLRVIVEKNNGYIKDALNCGSLKTQNRKTIKTDIYPAGITQLITVSSRI